MNHFSAKEFLRYCLELIKVNLLTFLACGVLLFIGSQFGLIGFMESLEKNADSTGSVFFTIFVSLIFSSAVLGLLYVRQFSRNDKEHDAYIRSMAGQDYNRRAAIETYLQGDGLRRILSLAILQLPLLPVVVISGVHWLQPIRIVYGILCFPQLSVMLLFPGWFCIIGYVLNLVIFAGIQWLIPAFVQKKWISKRLRK